ncbi:MAG: T9SS type A sorting domain-containing protein, partial [Calditrichaeota bacterium]|nr:T9SS type A sorting domain-containing protein [Calditrichota bacterium]
SFSVDVFKEEGEEAVGEALVCLYKADDEFQISKYTDPNGTVNFYINPDELSEGELMITVSKHNHKPYLEEIEVVNPENFIGISEWDIDDDAEGASDGDDDGRANPCETVEILTTFTNFGNENPDGAGQIEFVSLTPWIEVISEPVELEQAPAGGESIEATVVVQINDACPDGVDGLLSAVVTVGDSEWESFVNMDVRSPEIEVVEYSFRGGEFEPGEVSLLEITLRNVGNKLLPASTVTLVSENDLLDVVQEVEDFGIIARGRSVEDGPFRVAAHPFTIPGIMIPAYLIIEAESGFIDTVRFEIEVEGRDIGDPLGPDEYGYICFDSGDEEWEYCPDYNWIEIDPTEEDPDFRGTEIELRDHGDNMDVSAVRDLPFDFQYYGEVFDEITICSNGWAAFGDQSELADFRNRRIGQALGPDAQLCVWWDNLIVPNNSSVLYHYDEDGGQFIIEWNNVQRLVTGGNGSRETFQIVLYDPAVHDTDTGDGIILFQYKEVTNQNAMARNDHPYCTIGISNLEDSDGIEYTYWNTYPTGARQIENRMALLFITEADFRTGVLTGRITDEETGEPIPNAEIFTSRGFWGEADEDGVYLIDNILAKEDYTVTAVALGWNDSTLIGFDIVEDEILRVDFSLLHPEFTPSQEEFEGMLRVGDATEVNFQLTNTGNGPLTWSADRALTGQEEDFDPWQLRRQYPVGQVLEDSRIQGAVFADDRFYLVGSNSRDPQVYVLDRGGELVDQFDQIGAEGGYGMKDLTFDGELIWGGVGSAIYGFTTEGDLQVEIDGPFNPTNNFASDPDRGVLWVSSTTSNIKAIDVEGNEIGELNRFGMRQYGLAYWSDDPDGYPLYILHKVQNVADYVVHKMNPENNDTLFVCVLEPEGEGTPVAAFLTNEYDDYKWVFGIIGNNGPNDRIDLWHLAARRDWFGIEPEAGTLNPDEGQELTLLLNADKMPSVVFEGDIVFTHNALTGETRLPVILEILEGAGGPADRVLTLHQSWNLISLNITPEVQDIVQLMLPLTEGGILTLMKDGAGRFYLPEREFCNIPGWDPTGGYQINMSEDAELAVHGLIIAHDEPIPLPEGWNMSAYFPREAVDAVISLQGIRDQLMIAKDGLGQFYLPEFEFSNMGNLSEGNGYQFKVSEDVELIYAIGDVVASEPAELALTTHFPTPKPKGVNMSVLIQSDMTPEPVSGISNWEIGVYSEHGMLLGSGRFDGYGHCGLAIWGDDPTTEVVDGAGDGSLLNFRLWDGQTETVANIETISGNPVWNTDGLFVGKINERSLLPLEFGINAAYPNPFNSQVRLSYAIESPGFTSIRILDISGREVATLINNNTQSGNHSTFWNAHQMPSGLYVVRLESLGRVASTKLMLVK